MNKPDQKSLNTPESLNRAYIAPEIVRQRQRIIESLDIQAGEQILDIGCGTGFLTCDMAIAVGHQGSVLGIDPDTRMVESTLKRCRGMDYVRARSGDVCKLPAADDCCDVVTCTQVLLYVAEVKTAIREMHRVLNAGGRIAILETDWRGVVMCGNYPELSRTIIDAWDNTVASPNLPPKLPSLLRSQGFKAVKSEAIPLLNTSYAANSFSVNSIDWLIKNAYRSNAISKQEGKKWRDDLLKLGENGAYFFCLNRFLFTAVK